MFNVLCVVTIIGLVFVVFWAEMGCPTDTRALLPFKARMALYDRSARAFKRKKEK